MQLTRLLIHLFLFASSSLLSYEEESYIDFTPFLNTPLCHALSQAGALPLYCDYSKADLEETFDEFVRGDALNEASAALEKWSSDFFASNDAFPWKKSNYRFGIFGGQESTHKKSRLIQGLNCKMCVEYCNWILENKSEELREMPYLSRLLKRLLHLDALCHDIFLEKVHEISTLFPNIEEIFYTCQGKPRLPITLRLIRFERSERFSLPLHFDISVMSLIFPSDDSPLDECLVIAPADGSKFEVTQLKRALRPPPPTPNQSSTLLISGTLFSPLNIPILPTPHGVLPHHRDSRTVIVACLHIPNLDTSEQSTLLPNLTEIPSHLQRPNFP